MGQIDTCFSGSAYLGIHRNGTSAQLHREIGVGPEGSVARSAYVSDEGHHNFTEFNGTYKDTQCISVTSHNRFIVHRGSLDKGLAAGDQFKFKFPVEVTFESQSLVTDRSSNAE